MPALPAVELLDLLLPAYNPCVGFRTKCAGVAKWAPESGHVPRGYLGATARPDDVDLNLLVAEPGDPHAGAAMHPRGKRQSLAAEAVADTYPSFAVEFLRSTAPKSRAPPEQVPVSVGPEACTPNIDAMKSNPLADERAGPAPHS